MAFSWVLVEQKKEQLLLQKQNEIHNTQLSTLSHLTADNKDISNLGKTAPKDVLEQELIKYQKRKESRELIFCSAVVLIGAGATASSCWLIVGIARLLKTGWLSLINALFNISRRKASNENKQQSKISVRKDKNKSEPEQQVSKQQTILKEYPSRPQNRGSYNHGQKDAERIAQLYFYETSRKSEEALKTVNQNKDVDTKHFDQLAQNIRKTLMSDYQENTLKLEDSLRCQTENLEKQITEFKQMAQSVRETALKHAKPLNATIEELANEISAIREYASFQQEKVKKLQEKNDWKTIRAFCLRVIRTIDNLQKRIESLSEQGIKTSGFEEIRDELTFALEASSVEQFEPAINSEYRGQEKLAEAVKDKEPTNDPDMKGKIAKVIRAGYQYIIDDKNVKIVRPAQVKLYG